MRIAHVSDIHIRNLKFHEDYRKVFADFYKKLVDLKVDLVVNTGDTAHTKTNISPEFVTMTSEFFSNVAKICPMINVLGNHDLNLMNEDREDAITPIVEALNNPRVILLKRAGIFDYDQTIAPGFNFVNLAIADTEHWPRPPYPEDKINVGLFHGSVRDCVTDSLFRMTHVEYDHDIFEGLDYAMLGDIHKRQSFNGERVWYAGSMIQQNFGEDPDKGFLLWDIKGKNDWTVEFVELKGNRRFYTVKLQDDLRLPEMSIEPDSRIRISPPRSMTLVEQKAVEKLVKKKWNPHDVITLGVKNIGQTNTDVGGTAFRVENLRDVTVQENLLRAYLADKKLPEEMFNRILGMNRKYQVSVEQKEDMARGVNWRVLKMGWNNLYNYGDGNVIDFSQVKGLTGIFAPNASGKSGMIDVVTVGMFDCNTKEVMKNIHLVNDNKDKAAIILEVMANGERYTITREIERIKFARKGQAQEWGKTTLDFIRHDKDGGVEKLVQESRPDTEKQIRRRFGSFEDFMLTSLFAQWDPMDLIMCKETDRKRILFRFLDLDIFDEKAKLAKEDSKEWLEKLADLEDSNYEAMRDQLMAEQVEDAASLESHESRKSSAEDQIASLHEKIEVLSTQFTPEVGVFKKVEPNWIASMEKKVEEAKGQVTVCSMSVDGWEVEHKNLEHSMTDYNAEYVDKQVEKLEELEAALFSVKASVRDSNKHSEVLKKQVSLLENVPCGDKFPSCQFLVNAFKAKEELPESLKEAIELDLEEQRLLVEIVKLGAYRNQKAMHINEAGELAEIANKLKFAKLKLENANLTVEKLEAELEQAKLELARYEQVKRDLEKNDVIQYEIGKLKEELAVAEKGLKSWERELAELHKKMGARKTDIERLEKVISQVNDVKETVSAFEHFINAMGKDGIALQVLKQKLPIINEEINKILGSAAEFGVYIEYDKEDQSIRLYLQYGQYKSRLLELGSGAEKFLASVAIRSALLSISNLPRSNMFIIDEGFGKLDPQNLEAVSRMFDYLKTAFDHVIVISHSELMKDLVDNMIEINQDDEGYAHVSIGEG